VQDHSLVEDGNDAFIGQIEELSLAQPPEITNSGPIQLAVTVDVSPPLMFPLACTILAEPV
jgi:hypothetical protein